jgi:hypothetical protein
MSMVVERPILFSGPMVRAILEGRKTQTRRVILHPERLEGLMLEGEEGEWCPYGKPGDRLWVREKQMVIARAASGNMIRVQYLADGVESGWLPYPMRLKGFPHVGRCLSYGGYRESSRITLEVTEVRRQRVQEISGADALAEGCTVDGLKTWLEPIARKAKVEPLHWLYGIDDDTTPYCYKCACKHAKELQAKPENAQKEIIVDGGWGGEEDTSQNCEICGVRLEACLTRYGVSEEMEYHGENGIYPSPGGVYNFYDMLDGGDIPTDDEDDEVPDFASRVARIGYRWLWDSINAKRGYGWDKNPGVWVPSFRRIKP